MTHATVYPEELGIKTSAARFLQILSDLLQYVCLLKLMDTQYIIYWSGSPFYYYCIRYGKRPLTKVIQNATHNLLEPISLLVAQGLDEEILLITVRRLINAIYQVRKGVAA